jgi:protein required for attachment to host cells
LIALPTRSRNSAIGIPALSRDLPCCGPQRSKQRRVPGQARHDELRDEPPQPSPSCPRSPRKAHQEETFMPLPHNALVLVADGRKMLFFRNHGDEGQIDLRTEAHDRREDRKDSDIKTDSPGAIHQSAGYGRSTYEETDFHQQEEDRWIKEAADELNKRALRNDFDALAIVAPPKALGVLRKELRKDVESRLVCTVNKEMSGRPIPDIEALLEGETAAAELPPA